MQTKVDHFQVQSVCKFLRQFSKTRYEQTDIAVIHSSPSVGARPDVALFQKLKDSELSEKV